MGTSTSVEQLGGKLVQAGLNVQKARQASFRTAESRMLPRFRDQARAAAGGDRKLSGRKGAALDAKFKVTNSADSSFLFINPVGPWGIRDNTDVGGRTSAHAIRPRRRVFLKFMGRDGTMYVKQVNHPGSSRGPYWGRARDDSFKFVQKRIPEDTIRAIEAALAGSGFSTRA